MSIPKRTNYFLYLSLTGIFASLGGFLLPLLHGGRVSGVPPVLVKEVQSSCVQLPRASPVSLLGRELALQGKDPLSAWISGGENDFQPGSVSRLHLRFSVPPSSSLL